MNKVCDFALAVFCYIFVGAWFAYDYIKYGIFGCTYDE